MFEHTLSDQVGSIDPNLPVAVEMKDAEFTWDAPPALEKTDVKGPKHKVKEVLEEKPLLEEKPRDERIFNIPKINLSIPRGHLCAIVGPVGSGKSSLLQGL